MGYNFGTEEPAITAMTGKSVAERFVPSAETQCRGYGFNDDHKVKTVVK